MDQRVEFPVLLALFFIESSGVEMWRWVYDVMEGV